LRRSFEIWRADLGDKLTPTVEKVIDKLASFAHWVGPILQDALDFLRQRIDANGDGLEKFGTFLQDMEPIIKALVTGGIILLAGSIGLVIEATAEWGRTWERIKEVSVSVTELILSGFSTILNASVSAFGWIPGIGDKLRVARDQFDQWARDVTETLEGIPDQRINVRVELSGVDRIGSLVSSAVGAVVARQGISARASGGPTTSGVTMMHELGIEAVRLPTGSTVIPHGQTGMMLAEAAGDRGGREVIEMIFSGNTDSYAAQAWMRMANDGLITVRRSIVRDR
jgi:hypothetical protein